MLKVYIIASTDDKHIEQEITLLANTDIEAIKIAARVSMSRHTWPAT